MNNIKKIGLTLAGIRFEVVQSVLLTFLTDFSPYYQISSKRKIRWLAPYEILACKKAQSCASSGKILSG